MSITTPTLDVVLNRNDVELTEAARRMSQLHDIIEAHEKARAKELLEIQVRNRTEKIKGVGKERKFLRRKRWDYNKALAELNARLPDLTNIHWMLSAEEINDTLSGIAVVPCNGQSMAEQNNKDVIVVCHLNRRHPGWHEGTMAVNNSAVKLQWPRTDDD